MRLLNSLFGVLLLLTSNNVFGETILVDSLEDAVALAESSKQDILIVFSADWCKNCEILKREFLQSDNESLKDCIICIIDYDNRPDLIKEYRVRKIPDSRVMKKNIETSQYIGYKDKIKYAEWLKNARQ